MRMALTTYEGGKPAKVFEADEASLTVGVCEDVLRLIHADLVLDPTPEAEAEVVRAVVRAFMDFAPVVKRIFPGITDEEYRNCLPRDVGALMMGIVTYALGELAGVEPEGRAKNRRRRRRNRCTRRFSTLPSPCARGSRRWTQCPSGTAGWTSSACSRPACWTTSAGRGRPGGARAGVPRATTGSKPFQDGIPSWPGRGHPAGAVLAPVRPPFEPFLISCAHRHGMANDYIIGIGMGLDVGGLKQGLDEAKREMALADSEFKLNTAGLGKWTESIDGVTEKILYMATEVESKKGIVDAYAKELERVKDAYGDTSTEAANVQKKLNDAEAAYINAQTYTEKLTQDLEAMTSAEGLAEQDAGSLRKTVENLNKRLATEQKKLDGLNAELDDAKKLYGDDSEQAKKLTEKVKTQTTKVNTLKTSLNRCNDALKTNASKSKTATTYAGKLKTAFSNVSKAANSAVKGGLSKLKDKLMDLGKNALGGIAGAVKEFARQTLQLGMDFTETMQKVKATSKATDDEMKVLEDTAREYGRTTTFSAVEAAEALNYMALAGWKAEQSSQALGGVLSLASASGMDLAAASDMVTDYLSAFKMEASQSGHFADALAYAQSNANTTAEGLGEAYANSAAKLAGAGQSMEGVTALLMAMANQGTKGSEAGTALASTMSDITKKMKDGAIQIGSTAVRVSDAKGNFRSLASILADVEKATKKMGTAERASALGAVFTSKSLTAVNEIMSEGTSKVVGYEKALKGSDGTAQQMADTMNDSLAGDMKALNSALDDVKLRIFDCLEGPLRGVVQFITDAIPVLIEGAEAVYNFFVDVYNATKPFWDALGEFFGWLGEAIGGAGEAIGGAWDAVTKACGDVLGFFEDLGKGIVAFVEDPWGSIVKFFEGVWNGIVGAFKDPGKVFGGIAGTSIESIKKGWDKVAGFFGGIWNGIKNAFKGVASFFGGLASDGAKSLKSGWDNIKKFFEGIWNGVKGAFNGPVTFFKDLAGNMRSGLKDGWDKVKTFFEGIWNGVKGAFNGPITFFKGLAGNMRTGLKDGWDKIKDFFGGIWNAVKGAFSGPITFFKDLAGNMRSGLKDGWDKVKTFFEGIWNGIKGAFNAPITFFKGLAENIRTGLKDGWDTIKKFFEGIWNGVKSAFSGPITFFKDLAGNMRTGLKDGWDTIKKFFEGIWNGVKSAFSGVSDFFGGIAGAGIKGIEDGWNKVKSFFEGIWNGITQAFSNPEEAFKSIAKAMVSGVTGAWSTVKTYFEGIWNTIKAPFDGVATWFGQTFGGAWNAITGAFKGVKDFFDGVIKTIKDVFGPIISFFSSLFGGNTNPHGEQTGGAVGAMEAPFDGTKGFFDGVYSKITGAFSGITSFFSNTFGQAFKGITDIFGGIGTWFNDNVVKPVQNAVKGITDTVGDITGGVAEGIKSGTNDVLGGVQKFGEDIYNGITGFFGIHSPSTLMRDKVGAMIGAGVIEGMLGTVPDAVGAARTLSGAIDGGIGVGGVRVAGASAQAAGVVFNQTINSPTPLTAGQIYRDTRSLIARREWA